MDGYSTCVRVANSISSYWKIVPASFAPHAAHAAPQVTMEAATAPAHYLLIHEPVPITGANAKDVEAALNFKPLLDWAETLKLDARFVVKAINLQSVDYFGSGRVGFIKFKAEATFNGKRVNGVVFMRGPAVSVLPILSCGGEEWIVMCRQPRLPVGRAFLELPAGMLDGSGNFAGVAAKEMEEETGITMKEGELVDLTALAYLTAGGAASGGVASGGAASGGLGQSASSTSAYAPAPPAGLEGVFPSVGGCDEFIRLMLYRKQVKREELGALRGKATGVIAENEQITLELVPYKEAWRVTSDAKLLCSLLLVERLKEEGVLP